MGLNNLIDFHSHILPQIDDGSKSLEESLLIIKKEIEQGVGTIVLTPHFYPDIDNFDCFLEKRKLSYEKLYNAVNKENINIKLVLGCEVKFSPRILDLDLEKLCIENTDYILIEFSMTHYASWTSDVFFAMQNKGYTPIIAHVERYSHINDTELYKLVTQGCLLQVNTGSLSDQKPYLKRITTLIKHNLIHIWGSDAHSLDKRPPSFDLATDVLNAKFDENYLEECMSYAQSILKNHVVNCKEPIPLKRGLLKFINDLI